MATYYVSFTEGNDSNAGTSAATAWKYHPDSNLATSASAAKRFTLADGDIIYMMRGDTWYSTATATGQLTTGVAGTSAGITTTSIDTFSRGDGSLPIIAAARNFKNEAATWTSAANSEYLVNIGTTAPNVVYYGNIRLTSGTVGSLSNNQFGYTSPNLYVKIGKDPTGEDIQASQGKALQIAHGYRKYSYLDLRYNNDTAATVYLTGGTNSSVTYCNISRANANLLRTNGATYNTIQYNTVIGADTNASGIIDIGGNGNVSYNVVTGLSALNANGIDIGGTGTPTGEIVSYNEVSGCYNGIRINNTNSNSIFGNYTHDNGKNAGNTGFGIVITGTSASNLVYSNRSNSNGVGVYPTTNGGGGIYISGTASSNSVYQNYVYDNSKGIVHETSGGSGGNKIYYNVCVSNHINGIDNTNSVASPNAALEIFNNTVYHDPAEDSGGPGSYTGHGISAQINGKNTVIKNNNVYSVKTDSNVQPIAIGGSYANIVINYNNWYDATGVGHIGALAGTNYDSLTAWKSALNADSAITEKDANSISADPKFKSTSDFHLKASSPCINTGTTIEGLTTDFDGRKVPYSVAPDMGAYEYRPTVGPFRW